MEYNVPKELFVVVLFVCAKKTKWLSRNVAETFD